MEKKIFNGGITRFWWVPLITGLISIGLGVWCLIGPAESLPVLAYVFAGCICLAGVLNITFGIVNTAPYSNWGWSLALGLLELILGIWLFCLPVEVLVPTFMFTIGIYVIVITINALCEACVLSSYANDWIGWIVAFLLCALVFAVIFLAGPIANAIAIWLYIGIALICFGVYRIVLAAKIQKINKRISF